MWTIVIPLDESSQMLFLQGWKRLLVRGPWMKKYAFSNPGILIHAERLKISRGQRPTKGIANSYPQLMSILELVFIKQKVDRGGLKPR